MNTTQFAVNGNWRRALCSSDTNLEAQTITGTRAPFMLPTVPKPARTPASPARAFHGNTSNAIDDFFGVTKHESRYEFALQPPLYDADAELPAYSGDSNKEPITLAMYLFKFGFLFPPLWILGAIIAVSPLTVPADFEPSKSNSERQQLVQIIRDAELKWAQRCAWALFVLFVLAGIVVATALTLLHS